MPVLRVLAVLEGVGLQTVQLGKLCEDVEEDEILLRAFAGTLEPYIAQTQGQGVSYVRCIVRGVKDNWLCWRSSLFEGKEWAGATFSFTKTVILRTCVQLFLMLSLVELCALELFVKHPQDRYRNMPARSPELNQIAAAQRRGMHELLID